MRVRPFVGRDEELDTLRAGLEDAAAGHGALLFVSGEPGIGKTRLMQEVAASALDQGWLVAMGRCWEEGGAPAYWPWMQVVRAVGGELERLGEALPGAAGVDPESARFLLFDAVTRFLLEASGSRPLLIVLDDLHAADAPSLLLLRFLSQAVAQERILILGSYREMESRRGELAGHFAELARVAQRKPLAGLRVEDVEAYLTALNGEAATREVAARLQATTGGNPFFLTQIAELGDAAVPGEVRELIRRRAVGLSGDARAALSMAAVCGREFDLRLLEPLSGLSLGRLLDVLAEAVEARVVWPAPAPGRYTFAHDLVRATLYDDLSPSRRAELHLAIGHALEDIHRADLDPHLSEIAHHLAHAAPLGDPGAAVALLERAGERACSVLAYEEAILHFGRALELAPERRCELLLRLGDAQWRAGDVPAARQSFEAATDLARRLGDGELLARAALGYVTALGGFLLYARFEVGATGAGLLEEAAAALPEGDSPLRARVLARLAVEMYSASVPVERRLAVSEEAIAMARRLGDSEILVGALHAHHWALTTPEKVHERLAHTDEMLGVAEQAANREMQFLAHNARFHCFLELCDRRAVDQEVEAMAQAADFIRQPFFTWQVLCLRTVRAILDGHLDEAERLAGEALALAELRHGEYPAYVFHYAQMFAIRWSQGRLGEVWEAGDSHGDRFPWIPRWRDALGAAELSDTETARAELDRHSARDFADLPRDGLWMLHICALAEAAALVRDKERGEKLYELLAPFETRNAVSYTQLPFGPVALRLAMLAALLGRRADAERHFETALHQCDLLGAPVMRARVLREQARILGEDAPAGVFRREGDVWTLAYAGRSCRLKDTKGLQYLATLLASPGREIQALELAQGDEPVAAGDAPAVLDAQAKASYRERLRELGEDLEQARAWSDPERAAAVEEEIDALTEELARATGLGGRDRRLPSAGERARVSVTKAIRAAIAAVERHHPALGAHLAAAVRTGRFCCYAPPGEAPPAWHI